MTTSILNSGGRAAAVSLHRAAKVVTPVSAMVTHRRSIADRGGCFQRCLSVCLSTR